MKGSFRSSGPARRILAILAIAAVLGAQGSFAQKPAPQNKPSFASMISRLSEPGGFFDTDNLISNESSYLHVIGRLRGIGTAGGAYIGVGPDQNFSYIAAIRPKIAFILDIRRDNLLEHLMFKALFKRSRNRMEFLCRLLGRTPPADVAAWDHRTLAEMLDFVDAHPARASFIAAESTAIVAAASRTGVRLTQHDKETMRRFHAAFVSSGLDLQFTSFNRNPRPFYPTLRQLILEKDLEGKMASYLADEESFRFVKKMQAADLIIPVVGSFAGAAAFPGIGREIARRGEKVSAIYTSNVEQYLFRDGSFSTFSKTVAALPHDAKSVIIRSYFVGSWGGWRHPLAVRGHASTQLLQSMEDFVSRQKAGGWESYWDLVTSGAR
jgi:hypothetical protein